MRRVDIVRTSPHVGKANVTSTAAQQWATKWVPAITYPDLLSNKSAHTNWDRIKNTYNGKITHKIIQS